MSQEFSLVKDPNATVFENVKILSQAYTKGDAVMLDRTLDAVDVVPATSSTITGNIYGVAMETVTSSATSLLIARITPWQTWSGDASNSVLATHNMFRFVLTDCTALNNTTDSAAGIFQQTGIKPNGVATRVLGRFIVGYEAAA
jgi:hypothetical protein